MFGVRLALMLHQNIVFRALARSLILFPYFVSTVVAVLVWRWLFNDLYGILNHLLMAAGIIDMPLDWLGSMPNAMVSVILVGAWKYFPFVVIAVLARLQTIPEPLYEAARDRRRRAVARFFDVTLPQLRDVLVVVDPAARDLGLQGIRPDLPADRRRAVDVTQTLPLLVYKEAFGLQRDGPARRRWRCDDAGDAGLHAASTSARTAAGGRDDDALAARIALQPVRLDDRAGRRLPAGLDGRHLGQAAVRAVPHPADDPAARR